jgi:hypothetical protein
MKAQTVMADGTVLEVKDSAEQLVTRTEIVLPPLPATATPLEILIHAVNQGANPDTIKQLMDLRDRYEATEARKAYVKAMAEFKLHAPTIIKDKKVSYAAGGGTVTYFHARLGSICEQVVAGLAKVGISHRWDFKQEANKVSVTCVLTHAMGHEESVTMEGPVDTSGSKNAIQAIGSAQTYLSRYSLLAITGLATNDMDDDGAASQDKPRITDSQAADLDALISEVKADKKAFLKYLKIDSLEEILADNFKHVVAQLERKRQQPGR